MAVDGYIKSLITQGYQIEQDGNTYQINYTLIEQEPTIHKKPWNGEKNYPLWVDGRYAD